jgi:acyl dehydratase
MRAGAHAAAIEALEAWGRAERRSAWIDIDQTRIDLFARATEDGYWLHTDPARARGESPFGGTIAHGFLLLSLTVDADVERIVAFPGVSHVLNYGLNKVRFLAPVASGSRVRVHARLRSLTERRAGQWLLTQDKTVEVDGGCGSVLVAEHLILVTLGGSATSDPG